MEKTYKMKKIVLYGTGFAGEKFYCAYKKRYEIVYAIDQKNDKYFHGIPVYSLEEKRNYLKDYFIIVATETVFVYDEISCLLKECGLVEFENYEPAELVNRELMILYGNCHMRILKNYLQAHLEFERRFLIRYFYVADENENKRYPTDNELSHCKVLVLQDLKQHNDLNVPSGEEVQKKTSVGCEIIKIPNLYGCNLFFPQVGERYKKALDTEALERHIHENKNLPQDKNHKVAAEYVIGCRDENIERMLKKGSSEEEIRNMIENENVYDSDIIIQNFQQEMEKLKRRENYCDIIISDYIEKNYKKKQLFYDPGHPTNVVIYEKGNKILEILNIETDEKIREGWGEEALDDGEMFIYGCVKRALKLKFCQKYIRRYKSRGTLYGTAINLQEYIRGYIAWLID